MKLELDPRGPRRFKYDKLRRHVPDKCETADLLALQDSEEAHMGLGVSTFSIAAGSRRHRRQ